MHFRGRERRTRTRTTLSRMGVSTGSQGLQTCTRAGRSYIEPITAPSLMLKPTLLILGLLALVGSHNGFSQEDQSPGAASAEPAARSASSTPPPRAPRRSAKRGKVTPMPVATPVPRGFFERVFGRRTKTAARPSATVTPKPATAAAAETTPSRRKRERHDQRKYGRPQGAARRNI